MEVENCLTVDWLGIANIVCNTVALLGLAYLGAKVKDGHRIDGP